MFAIRDNRRMVLSALLAIAVLAVAIPTCVMIGCTMGNMTGGMMRITTHPGPVAGGPCGGGWLTTRALAGTVPGEFISFIAVLIAAMMAALKMFSPQVEFRPVRLVEANAPPSPLEPRGERYIL